MQDCHGRTIEYLRLSVTDRCNLKCEYCRAGEGLCPKQTELPAESILRIVRIMADLGISKVRLTGGEPTVRRDLAEIARGIRSFPGIREISMTTNGQLLAGNAKAYKDAGIDRLNISIDSLKPERYRKMTNGGELENVLLGIDDALAAGMLPLKLNAVLMRGVNEDEVEDFIELTRTRDLDMRFIELMPLGISDHSSQRIPTSELLSAHPELVPLPPRYPGQPSVDYQVPGYTGRVGFISPISHKFCGTCNRIRLTCDGVLLPCLGNRIEYPLKGDLGRSDKELREIIRDVIWNKPASHHFECTFQPGRTMSHIGG